MQIDYPTILVEDYQNYSYNHKLGGWKALHYFIHKGLSKSLGDGFYSMQIIIYQILASIFPMLKLYVNGFMTQEGILF